MKPLLPFRPDRAIGAELRANLQALWTPWLFALVVLVVAVLTIAVQLPVRFSFDVGYEEGFGSDLPFVSDFYPFEPDQRGAPLNWRWTSEQSNVALPGFGQRPLMVELTVLPINAELQERGAKNLEIWWHERQIATLPVSATGRVYRFTLPAETTLNDQQGFQIRSLTVTPTGDARSVGVPVDRISLQAAGGPTIPALGPMLLWLLAAVLGWLAVRRCGFGPRASFVMLGIATLLLGVAAICDPARTAFGAQPAVIALFFGWLLVIVLRAAVPPVAQRLSIPLDDSALCWLLFLALLAFSLRYGGKIYPSSMWGDIGFHANRFADVVSGRVLLLSRNRGVDFPYPPALYLLIAPFTLLGFDRRDVLRFIGALVDAFSPFLVYTIAILAYRVRDALPSRTNWPLVAAAVYSLTAATFMTTWWNFSTHIFTQFAHLLLITGLVLIVPMLLKRDAARLNALGLSATLVVMYLLVFLGHFGFWMNMSLLGGLGALVLVVLAWRKQVAWRGVWWLIGAFTVAELIAIFGFYSAYTGLFVQQAIATSEGGLNGMAGGRAAIPLATLWRTLWDYGFRIHFGFFPVPLALIGVGLWWYQLTRPDPNNPEPIRGSRFSLVLWLISGTFLIGGLFAALPFVTGSSLSTRWLMFSAWGIAIAATYCVRASWRWGWPARVAAVLMACYILWVTANVWLGALAFRIRPPEPF